MTQSEIQSSTVFRKMVRKLWRAVWTRTYLRVWRIVNLTRYREIGKYSFVRKPLLVTPGCIVLKDRVRIDAHCRIQGVTEYGEQEFSPIIVFDQGVSCQQNLHMTCAERIYVGKDTAIAANVTITDINHRFEDIELPVEKQPLDVVPVYIGSGSKIYNNAVILPGVRIGKHCVIGANSVVTSNVPDYSVVAGIPARVIRRYDAGTGTWERVRTRGKDEGA